MGFSVGSVESACKECLHDEAEQGEAPHLKAFRMVGEFYLGSIYALNDADSAFFEVARLGAPELIGLTCVVIV